MKKFLFSSIGTALCIATTVASVHAQQTPFSHEPFTDVSKTDVNFEAIEFLRTSNVLKGYLDGEFKADNRITRAEFMTLLTNPFFLTGTRESNCLQTRFGSGANATFYSDVDSDDWFAEDLCAATVRKIVHGYPDNTFKPHDSINFVEAAKITASVLALDVRDLQTGDAWYTVYVQRLADLNAIPTTVRRFDQTLTRGEMAEIVFRLKTANSTKASMKFSNLQ